MSRVACESTQVQVQVELGSSEELGGVEENEDPDMKANVWRH